MRMVDLILKTRAGEELARQEIEYIVNGFVNGDVPDYQMAAWLMAVCFTDMSSVEIADLTRAMVHSGDLIDLSSLRGVKVDKHSTGGVGDTTTLVVAPLVAACGGTVAKMSGRGLGHTGGTLDKLEAVPGVTVSISEHRFKEIVNSIGLCVMGQTGNLDPADKLIYALRDVTGTVESVPLIASSIMSKKIAAGADAIVLDVKVGSGAFMQTIEDARRLARTMVDIGEHVGRKTIAVITDMNQPLGLAVGNGLEMKEAIETLAGKTPPSDPLYEVCMLLASKMLLLANIAQNDDHARGMLQAALDSRAGLGKLEAMLAAMGGDTACIKNPEVLCRVKRKLDVFPTSAGYIADMDAVSIGVAAQLLGAGREKKNDSIDPAVGLVMRKRRGDYIRRDEPLATLYVNDSAKLPEAAGKVRNAVSIAKTPPARIPMIYDVIE